MISCLYSFPKATFWLKSKDMCDRLTSSTTLMEGIGAVGFGDVGKSRKKELEELIHVPCWQYILALI